jgi:uncharacterized protein DUF4012
MKSDHRNTSQSSIDVDDPTKVSTLNRDREHPRLLERPARRRSWWSRWRHRVKWGATVLGVVISILALALVAGLQARGHLRDGEQALKDAQTALAAGDLDAARAAFARAEDAFIAADGSMGNPVFALFRALPVAGRTPDVVSAIARSGATVAGVGSDVTSEIASLPGGLGALAPDDGAFRVASIERLAPTISYAADRLQGATDEVAATAPSLLLAPVADARRSASDALNQLVAQFRDAETILDRAPWLLGGDEPRTYLFVAQNPAELRGAGGLMGVYSILTIDDGKLTFSDFRPDATAPSVPSASVQPPNRNYARIYGRYGGLGSWQNANMSPDVPSVAVALENLWRASGRGELDGVFFSDPFALKRMLSATGPVRANSLDTTLTSDNVVPFVTNAVYSRFASPLDRKIALGVAADDILRAFLSGTGSPEASFEAMTSAVGQGHLQLHVDDVDLERALLDLSVGGALAGQPGDFLAVIQNNQGGNKVDYYLDRSIEYSVKLGPLGAASGTIQTQMQNDAPLRGAPKYVLGPFKGRSHRAENVSLLATYCAKTCAFTSRSAEGSVDAIKTAREQGHPFAWDHVQIPSGGSAGVTYTTALQNAWVGDAFGGTYRLTLVSQPTIRPTPIEISIQAPEGMAIVSTSVPMTVEGSIATWKGVPNRSMEIDVRFQPPLARRVWLTLWHG